MRACESAGEQACGILVGKVADTQSDVPVTTKARQVHITRVQEPRYLLVADQFLNRERRRELRRIHRQWKGHVDRRAILMTSAEDKLLRRLHHILALAYETWHEHANAQARIRGILKRIAERWLHRDVAVAFLSWKENADRQKRAEYITGRILRHWTHRTSAAAFDSWHAHAQEQVRVRIHALRALWQHIAF